MATIAKRILSNSVQELTLLFVLRHSSNNGPLNACPNSPLSNACVLRFFSPCIYSGEAFSKLMTRDYRLLEKMRRKAYGAIFRRAHMQSLCTCLFSRILTGRLCIELIQRHSGRNIHLTKQQLSDFNRRGNCHLTIQV